MNLNPNIELKESLIAQQQLICAAPLIVYVNMLVILIASKPVFPPHSQPKLEAVCATCIKASHYSFSLLFFPLCSVAAVSLAEG